MSRDRVAVLIHNARNRLALVAGRLQEAEADQLRAATGQLASAMALLRLEEAGIRPQEVDLEIFFADLMEEVAALAPTHLETTGKADFSACPFASWLFDGQLVRLVLLDALMNAWRHGRQRVHLQGEWRDDRLQFTIRDDGPGFPAEGLAAWARGDAGNFGHLGTGQGLVLAQRIAALHMGSRGAGRVALANDPAGGAVFRLILP